MKKTSKNKTNKMRNITTIQNNKKILNGNIQKTVMSKTNSKLSIQIYRIYLQFNMKNIHKIQQISCKISFKIVLYKN